MTFPQKPDQFGSMREEIAGTAHQYINIKILFPRDTRRLFILAILTSVPFLALLAGTEQEDAQMVYDWTGQRTRRTKVLRAASIAILLLFLIAVPVLLLHYNFIQYPY
ncbi:hypothetical protein [Rhizobium sp. RCC_161_2]|uniref:hypothetical protein n=1 Tax=Rhizobium sp. RCC_161_2 TaxID=3239219 RepID=UPI00352471BE